MRRHSKRVRLAAIVTGSLAALTGAFALFARALIGNGRIFGD
jgi:hypothetical protein